MKYNILLAIYFISFSNIWSQTNTCYQKKRMCDRKYNMNCYDKVSYDTDRDTYYSKGDFSMTFDGTCETCYRNGVLQERVTIKNGKRDGSDTSFFQSGCVQSVQAYVMGKMNGLNTVYFDSTGRIEREVSYLLGKLNGKSLWYERSGDTIALKSYLNDIQHGEQRDYYPGGKIYKIVNYQNGLLNGSHKTFDRPMRTLSERVAPPVTTVTPSPTNF